METLKALFTDSDTITLKCRTRVSGDVPSDAAVESHFTVVLSGVPVKEALNKDFAVDFQKALRSSFDEQEQLADWSAEHASPDSPYRVHINDLTKQIEDPAVVAQRMKSEISRLDDEKARAIYEELQRKFG